MFGSYKDTGLGSGNCFDRYSRNSPYGYEERLADSSTGRPPASKVEWEKVDWGRLQRECVMRNQARYGAMKEPKWIFRYPSPRDIENINSTLIRPQQETSDDPSSYFDWIASRSRKVKKRSAVLLRTFDSKKYTPDNIQHIRSMITELSLHSGGEYEVFLLIQIRDLKRPIFVDPEAYQRALDDYVPQEFHNISILFNVPLLEAWYIKAGKHDPKNSQQVHMTQPLQLFSFLRPDFDLYWQSELDVRYTGHHYHHLEAIRQWAVKQPRRLQWERASFIYSTFVHRTWKNFMEKVREVAKDNGIWGPLSTTGIIPVGPDPPVAAQGQDKFEWGVGEPADMINVMPIIDPVKTHMMFRNGVDNYPDKLNTPRRSAPVTPLIAISKRLLRAMHHSQVTMGTHMMPEMYPESSALHHGMKTVAFPEPVYVHSDQTPEQLESIFNAQNKTSIWNGGSPHAKLAQHVSFWWSAGFQPEYSNVLYRKWLGIDKEGNLTDHKRLCLPPILLHPIKGI